MTLLFLDFDFNVLLGTVALFYYLLEPVLQYASYKKPLSHDVNPQQHSHLTRVFCNRTSRNYFVLPLRSVRLISVKLSNEPEVAESETKTKGEYTANSWKMFFCDPPT